jgi:hypothetical protein
MSATSKLQPVVYTTDGVEKVGLLVTCDFEVPDTIWGTYFLPRMPNLMRAWSKKKMGKDSASVETVKLQLADKFLLTTIWTAANANAVPYSTMDTLLSLLCSSMDEFHTFSMGGDFIEDFKSKMLGAVNGLCIAKKPERLLSGS